jgi:CheY-like chemotaxis protein
MPRVLVVDDDAAVRSAVSRGLVAHGYEVVEAPDGRVALRLFREHPADVVLTDLYMPDVDGIEFTRQLSREFAGARIIAMSGGVLQNSGDALEIATHLGAVASLPKPFSLPELVEVVTRVLADRRAP